MKILRTLLWCLFATLSLWLLWGCSANRLDSSNIESAAMNSSNASSKRSSGVDRVFTNANFVMWVPSRAAHVWDGPTSVVDVDEITPPGAFVKDYKIHVDIMMDTEQEFNRFHSTNTEDWDFQEHPTLSMMDRPIGKQFRKDIRDLQRGRILVVNAAVQKSDTFQEDVETAKKMIESIKLIPK